MSAVAETALAFCRECMGWEDAYLRESVEFPGRRYVEGVVDSLCFSDLAEVMDAVRKWCRSSNLDWCLASIGTQVSATVGPSDSFQTTGESDKPDPCHALLAACVGAARKLKEAA